MNQHRKLLILNYNCATVLGRCRSLRELVFRPMLVVWLVRVLKVLGYRFVTVHEAMTKQSLQFEKKLACITFENLNQPVYKKISPYLIRHGIKATAVVSVQSIRKIDQTTSRVKRQNTKISWKTLQEIKNIGWEIGTMGNRHRDLTRVSLEDLGKMIVKCKEIFEEKINYSPKVFMYPLGSYDTTLLKVLRENGFQYGITKHFGVNFENTDTFSLKILPLTSRSIVAPIRFIMAVLQKQPPAQSRAQAWNKSPI